MDADTKVLAWSVLIVIACSNRDRRDTFQAGRSTRAVVQLPSEDTVDASRGASGQGESSADAVLGGRPCPSGASDSVRVTADLVLCSARAQRGADLITIPIDSVANGTGRYIEATKTYVPAPDTTVWMIVTRRAGGDVVRLVRGPVAASAPTVATLAAGARMADSVGVGTCRLDHGPTQRDIIAVLRYTRGAEWLHAVRAWRAVPRPPHFEALPSERVDCLNEEG